ncbi:MAG: hypothetical protein JST21_14315 [Bacteroidetes bacterium]|nr:hypothetical protein [Bacteroidota bacterium]
MGLCIHFKGNIKNYDLIPGLVEEIADICEAMQWTVTILKDEDVNGIVFSPEKCEPLFFTFNKDGQLVSPIMLEYKIEPATTITTKTQFAGMDTHIALIKLLRYISEKYFSYFHLYDEGNYWETNDEKILQRQFSTYNMMMDAVADAMENINVTSQDNADTFTKKIVEYLNRKNKKDE